MLRTIFKYSSANYYYRYYSIADSQCIRNVWTAAQSIDNNMDRYSMRRKGRNDLSLHLSPSHILLFEQQRRNYRLLDRLSPPLSQSSIRFASNDRKSRFMETLRLMREDLQRQQQIEEQAQKSTDAAVDAKKSTSIWMKIVNEVKHFYHGFRLLILETRLSAKYVWRMSRGGSLTRRERQQLVRTMSDLFRLVPFSIFVIVPFMEFLLPFFIKFFPNMLPSTFQEPSREAEKLQKQLAVKLEMAKFLQDTLEESGQKGKMKKKPDTKSVEDKGAEVPTESTALEFAEFIRDMRAEGGYVSNADLFKFTKLFEDELTLDNLSVAQLRALCRMLLIRPFGPPEILRFQLTNKLRELKNDDREIAAEGGVDMLSVEEVQTACRARGMRALGVSEQRLRDQLKQWLELSLNDEVPPTLLLMSRTLYLPGDVTLAERLKALVSSMPASILEEIKQDLVQLEGAKLDYAARLNLIRAIEKAIEDDRKADEEAKIPSTVAEERGQIKLKENDGDGDVNKTSESTKNL